MRHARHVTSCWVVTVSGLLCSGDDSITSGMRRLGAVTTKTTVKCSFYDFTPCWIISDTTTRHDGRRSKHSSHRAGRREAVMLLGCWLGHNIIFKSASRPGRINLRFHLYTSTGGDIEFWKLILFFSSGRGPQKNNYNIRIQHMVKIDPMISHKTQNFRAVKATMNKAKGD